MVSWHCSIKMLSVNQQCMTTTVSTTIPVGGMLVWHVSVAGMLSVAVNCDRQ